MNPDVIDPGVWIFSVEQKVLLIVVLIELGELKRRFFYRALVAFFKKSIGFEEAGQDVDDLWVVEIRQDFIAGTAETWVSVASENLDQFSVLLFGPVPVFVNFCQCFFVLFTVFYKFSFFVCKDQVAFLEHFDDSICQLELLFIELIRMVARQEQKVSDWIFDFFWSEFRLRAVIKSINDVHNLVLEVHLWNKIYHRDWKQVLVLSHHIWVVRYWESFHDVKEGPVIQLPIQNCFTELMPDQLIQFLFSFLFFFPLLLCPVVNCR